MAVKDFREVNDAAEEAKATETEEQAAPDIDIQTEAKKTKIADFSAAHPKLARGLKIAGGIVVVTAVGFGIYEGVKHVGIKRTAKATKDTVKALNEAKSVALDTAKTVAELPQADASTEVLKTVVDTTTETM